MSDISFFLGISWENLTQHVNQQCKKNLKIRNNIIAFVYALPKFIKQIIPRIEKNGAKNLS